MRADPVYLTVGVALLPASAVAGLWTLRADRARPLGEAEGFARADRRVMLAFALVNLLAAAVILASVWRDA